MLEKRVIVELSPSRLGAALWKRGHVVASAAERHDAARFRDDWAGALGALRPQLKSMVTAIGGRGRPATIVYSSPSAVCGVFSCPVSAGSRAWERAARLAVAEAASFPAGDNPLRSVRIASDAIGDVDAADAPPHAHTLGVADADATVEALADWASSAGVSPIGFIPSGAVALASAVKRALAPAPVGTATIVLELGEHSSVLAIAAHRRLRLVRQLGFGTELLAESLSRALGTASGGASSDTLARARQILGTIGIPAKDQIVDAGRGTTGAAILPALQPLLQRLLIEAKQSLRFGLSESQRASPALIIIGPGARTPGLAAMIAEQTGAMLVSAGPVREGQPTDPRALDVLLVPRALRARLQGRAAARGLWTGGLAAAAAVAFMAVMARTDLARARAELRMHRVALDESAEVRGMVSRLVAARLGLADARRRLDAAFAGTTDWAALMTAVGEETPEEVWLGTIELSIDRDRPICRIRGQARARPGQDPSAVVRTYLDRLKRLPIVRECRLGSTQRIGDDQDPRQTFILTLTLVDLPPALAFGQGDSP